MSPTKTFSAWKPPPSHSKALTSALKSVGKTIGGNLKNGFDFNKHKESITRALFDEFNANVFERQLPDGFEITWSKKLLTTAGLTVYKRTTIEGVRHFAARIELSAKVLDSVHKLEATLLHEMCHAAAWLVDHVAKPPHGDVFKKWAKLAMQTYPGTNVSTCHAYAIHTPFKWKCTQTWCEQEYGRHSKSIDVEKKRCGLCGGRLEFMGKFTSDGVLVKGSNVEKKATGYAKFVQDNFGDVKKELGNKTPHKKIMEKLSEKWNEKKKAGKNGSGESSGSSSGNNESFSEDKENIPKEAPGTISKAAARFTKMALFEEEIMSFTEKKKKKSVSIQEEEEEVETKMKAMNLNSLLLEEE
jgi:predicted SprT family Zn-dependent metalloprotease